MAEIMERFAICHLNDIPSRQARGFVLARRDDDGTVRSWLIFVLRWGKQVLGYENACPHEGVHLDWERDQFLDGDGMRIQCGKHGALFDFGTGECVAGPCMGERLIPVPLVVDEDDDICVVGVTLEEDDDFDSGQGVE
ncbi:MAG: Rieske 2Fe-2S domain-containing protein [Sphingobium sp.]|nr:Rieske 2Fe-2S domain-containing protein [Sphingobium sp.]MCP5399453.1 Rieske 2Fe-2S domain-containing protein [Sphingomonas sp.]